MLLVAVHVSIREQAEAWGQNEAQEQDEQRRESGEPDQPTNALLYLGQRVAAPSLNGEGPAPSWTG